jgi:hypothetical protein
MNGKAVLSFTMAGLCALGAIGYFNDGLKALRGDVWRDAMRVSPNGAEPSTVNAKVTDKETAE